MIMMDMVVVGEKVLFGRDLLNYYFIIVLFIYLNALMAHLKGPTEW